MSFEVFDLVSKPEIPQEPIITIRRSGTLSMNRAAWSQIGEARTVELLYDADNKRIGVRAATGEGRAYKISMETHGNVCVHIRTMARHYGIELTNTLRYFASKHRGRILAVSLDSPVADVTRHLKEPA